jgi:Protein of unknown function (DUF2846)
MWKLFATSCLAMLLAGCASYSAVEPQNHTRGANQARLYFVRQPTVLSRLGTADIKVDDKPIGSLSQGTYLVADRSPGRHTISVFGGGVTSGWFETDIQVLAGVSYYLEIGPIVRINADLLKLESMGVTGRPLPGRADKHAFLMLYALDAAAGAASVARLSPGN